jgi:MFS family permease
MRPMIGGRGSRTSDLGVRSPRTGPAGSGRAALSYDWRPPYQGVFPLTHRLRAWLTLWGPVLPLLVAEATIWLGFGALLPILPLYFTAHGVDLPMLGVVVAAWPAARLVGEPAFGWLADRVSRRSMMVAGLFTASVFAVLPLFVVGPAAFIVLRALAGLSASAYDPAARAYLVDANPPERQGEAFGVYGAAQTGGFMLGPAIGGVAAGLSGHPEVVFWVCGITLLISGFLVLLRVPEVAHIRHAMAPHPAAGDGSVAPAAAADPVLSLDPAMGDAAASAAVADVAAAVARQARPTKLVNAMLLAAICFSMASYFAGGVYEVVWSVYMTSLGADVGLIGLSFFTFGLPPLLLSTFAGRFIDREGGFMALVFGIAGIAVAGLLYPQVKSVWWMVGLGLFEGAAFAFATPAIFLLAARAAPEGRTSSAQGLLGGAGTAGTIVASLAAGWLAGIHLELPFYVVGVAGLSALAIGLALGRRRLYEAMQPRLTGHPAAPAAGAGA